MIGRSIQPAARAAAVAPFHVMRILERAKALECSGRDIIHMEVGEPDFPTPAPVMAAARRALDEQPMGYTPAAGLPQLRRAIAGWYARRFDVDIDPARVIVTPGGSGGLQLVLSALLDPGDGVLVTDPGYPCNRHLVSLAGGTPVLLPLSSQTGYRPSCSAVGDLWSGSVRGLMVSTPANPTGAVISSSELAALYDLAVERAGALVVDEIYQGLVYDAEDHTALRCGTDAVFVVNSFSKYFGMTGWRLGWVVVPPGFVGVLERLAQNLFLAPSTLAQYAALAALEPETEPLLDARRAVFRERRDALVAALSGLGLNLSAVPQGAFYLYAGIPDRLPDAERLVEGLLEATGVAVTPGLDFGTNSTRRMLRLAYALDLERLREAIRRLAAYLSDWPAD